MKTFDNLIVYLMYLPLGCARLHLLSRSSSFFPYPVEYTQGAWTAERGGPILIGRGLTGLSFIELLE
jgi:hypothetical protein